ncbi:MAG TPA: Ldh family oxidoreductase [Anaerolineaceae bacterium]|nr:Ldh family oxidoreductase [Anaerolineaceae bacterium]
MTRMLLYHPAELRAFVTRFFEAYGVPSEDAIIAADVLVSADERGVESHGVIRLKSYYGSRLSAGLMLPRAELHTLSETPATLALDAGNALGQPASYRAMQRCLEKAHQSGLALVTVRNSNHYGIAGYYAMMALEQGLIGISSTNSQPLVAPTYGRTRLLGTNPIAVAVPAGRNRPYVLDMATSIVPIGRMTVFKQRGEEIPAGWGVDGDGHVTTDPAQVLEGGALMPLGGVDLMRGYKGYGLALLVDLFCGVLAGAGFGSMVGRADRPANVGHCFAAVRLDAFRPAAEFLSDMDVLIDELKNAPKELGQERIFIHGEKEFERAELARTHGVPLMETTVTALRAAGQETGVPFDLPPLGEVV